MKSQRKLNRLEGLAYGAFAGLFIGGIAAIYLLFTSQYVESKTSFWSVVLGVVLLCGAIGSLFPKTAKIIATILSMIPTP
jgi:hypothetical protein